MPVVSSLPPVSSLHVPATASSARVLVDASGTEADALKSVERPFSTGTDEWEAAYAFDCGEKLDESHVFSARVTSTDATVFPLQIGTADRRGSGMSQYHDPGSYSVFVEGVACSWRLKVVACTGSCGDAPVHNQTFLDVEGSGKYSSPYFTPTADQWDLAYWYDCSHAAQYEAYGTAFDLTTRERGDQAKLPFPGIDPSINTTDWSAVEHYSGRGTYYLEINSLCPWHIIAGVAGSVKSVHEHSPLPTLPVPTSVNGGQILFDESGVGTHTTTPLAVLTPAQIAYAYDCSEGLRAKSSPTDVGLEISTTIDENGDDSALPVIDHDPTGRGAGIVPLALPATYTLRISPQDPPQYACVWHVVVQSTSP